MCEKLKGPRRLLGLVARFHIDLSVISMGEGGKEKENQYSDFTMIIHTNSKKTSSIEERASLLSLGTTVKADPETQSLISHILGRWFHTYTKEPVRFNMSPAGSIDRAFHPDPLR